MPGILQVGDQQVVARRLRMRSSALRRVGRGVDVVLGERQRLRQQLADARLVVDDEHARAARRGRPAAAAAQPAPLRERWLSSHASMSRLRKRHWRPTRTAGIFPALISR